MQDNYEDSNVQMSQVRETCAHLFFTTALHDLSACYDDPLFCSPFRS
jgi:hypothetical protein